MKRPTLRQLNNVLSVVVVILSLYLLFAPFWPKVTFEVKDDPPLVHKDAPIPDENTLVIPKMKLQAPVYEGGSAALSKGIWHRPGSSTPESGGNTVLTGHRFTYGGPAVLYHLDKVEKGDEVLLYWQQKKYEYRVEKVLTVPPTASEIEAQTSDPILTIYTCTPLITARDRLVIQAVPIGESQ